MQNNENQREIALLLDWENIRFGLQQRNLVPNISAIREEAESLGRVVVSRAYADFQNYALSNDPRRLYAAGIEPVYVPGRVYQSSEDGLPPVRKNSVDVKLTADCVDFCHLYPNIEVYMLVSGDGDFIHLVKTLRPYGKFVAIVALSWTASPRLTESADWVRYYDLDVEPSASIDHEKQPEPVPDAPKVPIPNDLRKVYQGIKDIVEDQKGPLVLAALKPMLAQKVEDFQERKFGHAKFKPLVMEAEDAGYVRVVTEGLVDWVMPVDTHFDSVDEEAEDAIGFDHTPGFSQAERGGQGTFDLLPGAIKGDIIRFSDSLEQRSRYVTFRYLSQNLSQQPWIQLEYNYLVNAINSAIDEGLFTRETYEDFDEYTGLIRRLPTLKLNRDHAQVESVLQAMPVRD